MSTAMRIKIERQIAARAVSDALKAGYALNLDYGDGDVFAQPCTDRTKVLTKIMQGDDDHLYYYKDGKCIGWAWFVYGNGGYDVLSDYTVNLEPVLAGASKLAERYSD